MGTLTFSQHDELSEIRRLTLAVTMAVFGSVSLDSFERSALIAIASLVSIRMSALVDEINEHDDANASPVLAASDAKPKLSAARTKRKGK